MALDAGLYHDPGDGPAPPPPAALKAFSADVDTTLRALSAALRDPSSPPTALPNLRADQRTLVRTSGSEQAHADTGLTAPSPAATGSSQAQAPHVSGWLALVIDEADRIVDSVNTLTGLIRKAHDTAVADPEQDMLRLNSDVTKS